MSINSVSSATGVRAPPPLREVERTITASKERTQKADEVKISARAQEAYEASKKGGDADHDGD